MDAPRATGRLGGQDFDVVGNWLLIAACVQDALRAAVATGADVDAVAATSMREGIVLYDEAGQEIWACPNVDSRSATEATELIAEGAAERIYQISGDWVSITAPAGCGGSPGTGRRSSPLRAA